MKRQNLNLARRPFVNQRPVVRVTILLWVLGGLLLLADVALYWSFYQGQGETRVRLAEIQAAAAREREIISRVVTSKSFDGIAPEEIRTLAASGIAVYQGDRFPAWRGDVFVGGLAGQQLARVRFQGGQRIEAEVLLGDHGRRVRDVRNGPDGYLYLRTDEPDGAILRLEPVA